MSSLVDSTYRGLIGRFQRGGTGVKPAVKPDTAGYRWGFAVFSPDIKPDVSVMVEVGLLTRNVYKNDRVEIVVSGLVGTIPVQSFISSTGNCPPLDLVEAFVRQSLAAKQASPRPLPDPSPEPSEPVVVSLPEPVQRLPEPEPELPSRSKRRGRRYESTDQPLPPE